MRKVNQHTTGHSLFVNIGGWKEVRNMAPHLRRYGQSDIARERMRIINFYVSHGEEATKQAFGVDRKLIYVWRKRIKEAGNRPAGLIPNSTAPKRTRRMIVHPKVLEFIKEIREERPRIGKDKIKPLLDECCQKRNLPTYSASKIGRIISKHNLFYQKSARVYHDPGSWHARAKRKRRERIKYAPKPTGFGHIQMDTVIRVEDGVRHYLYSAIDIKGKFALSLLYKTSTSKNTLDFFKKLKRVYPGKIKSVQTDNGSEFLGVFEEHLAKKRIKHLFIYPRCPRINGVVERYQRSLQEEFVDPNVHLLHNLSIFSHELADYIIFYNTKRVHQSLNYEAPLDYMIKKGQMSNKYWTRTRIFTTLFFQLKYRYAETAEKSNCR